MHLDKTENNQVTKACKINRIVITSASVFSVGSVNGTPVNETPMHVDENNIFCFRVRSPILICI